MGDAVPLPKALTNYPNVLTTTKGRGRIPCSDVMGITVWPRVNSPRGELFLRQGRQSPWSQSPPVGPRRLANDAVSVTVGLDDAVGTIVRIRGVEELGLVSVVAPAP